MDPALAVAPLERAISSLSAREEDVLRGCDGGATTADLAGRMCFAESTVRNDLSAAIAKTGARTRAEALATARERGCL